MNTIMFVNGMDKVHNCYVAPDDSQYGKFMCVYSIGGNIQQYKHHKKCGFKSAASAISWYFERFPDGNVLTERNFLELQGRLLTLTIPASNSNIFNPVHMTEKPKPVAAKRDKTGKIISDFE
jgi:hypothetical protein